MALKDLWSREGEGGATMVEYGLIVALIALVVASGASVLGQRLAADFDGAADAISGVVAEEAPAPAAAEVPPAADVDGGAAATAAKGANGKSGATAGWGRGSGGGRDK